MTSFDREFVFLKPLPGYSKRARSIWRLDRGGKWMYSASANQERDLPCAWKTHETKTQSDKRKRKQRCPADKKKKILYVLKNCNLAFSDRLCENKASFPFCDAQVKEPYFSVDIYATRWASPSSRPVSRGLLTCQCPYPSLSRREYSIESQ